MASTSANLGLTLPEMTDKWEDIIPGLSTSLTAIDNVFDGTSSGGGHVHDDTDGNGPKILPTNLNTASTSAASRAVNGFSYIGDLLWQWGLVGGTSAGAAGTSGYGSFSITYSSQCYSLQLTVDETVDNSGATSVRVATLSSTGFRYFAYQGGSLTAADGIRYLAIGK